MQQHRQNPRATAGFAAPARTALAPIGRVGRSAFTRSAIAAPATATPNAIPGPATATRNAIPGSATATRNSVGGMFAVLDGAVGARCGERIGQGCGDRRILVQSGCKIDLAAGGTGVEAIAIRQEPRSVVIAGPFCIAGLVQAADKLQFIAVQLSAGCMDSVECGDEFVVAHQHCRPQLHEIHAHNVNGLDRQFLSSDSPCTQGIPARCEIRPSCPQTRPPDNHESSISAKLCTAKCDLADTGNALVVEAGLVAAGFQPVAAGRHRAPAARVGLAAIDQEQPAFVRVLTRPQPPPNLRPRKHRPSRKPRALKPPLHSIARHRRHLPHVSQELLQTPRRRLPPYYGRNSIPYFARSTRRTRNSVLPKPLAGTGTTQLVGRHTVDHRRRVQQLQQQRLIRHNHIGHVDRLHPSGVSYGAVTR